MDNSACSAFEILFHIHWNDWILESAGWHSRKYHAQHISFIDGLILSPSLALVYIQKKQLCLKKTKENRHVTQYSQFGITKKINLAKAFDGKLK